MYEKLNIAKIRKHRYIKEVKINAAEYTEMYRSYLLGRIVSSELESGEKEGKMARLRFGLKNGYFKKNGCYVLKPGEVQRFVGDDNTEYLAIEQFSRLVQQEEFYSFLYPMICNKIVEIEVDGTLAKVIEDDVFKQNLANYKSRINTLSSLHTLKELESLIGLSEVEFIRRQGEIIMTNLKVGDKVVVRVKRVEEKFAIVCLTSGSELSFILHVSKLRDAYISDSRKYLFLGQEIQVEIAEVIGEKVQVSTMNTPLCKADATYYERNGQWMPLDMLEREIDKCKEEYENRKVMARDSVNGRTEIMTDSAGEVAAYIENKTGPLSEQARSKLVEMISKNGVFKMGIGIEKTMEKFNIDTGLYVMKRTEELLKAEK